MRNRRLKKSESLFLFPLSFIEKNGKCRIVTLNFLLVFLAIVFLGCTDKNKSLPKVETGGSTVFEGSVAVKCEGCVINDGGSIVYERGICYVAGNGAPTLSDNKVSGGSGCGSFSCAINLPENGKYSYRAYAINEKGIAYGAEKSFTLRNSGDGDGGGGTDDGDAQSMPIVTTDEVNNIMATTATCGGNVTSDGGGTVIVRGICWSTSSNPTISGQHTINGSGMGPFTSHLTGLTANTTYYVRAYATNNVGTSYGGQKSFTTPNSGGSGSGVIAGHEYVDLGLPSGLLWATCNVGATSPEGYGDYFAWGETTTKTNYSWDTYMWFNSSASYLTKYNTDSEWGTVDNKTILMSQDDVAHVRWGSSWRMPTEDEIQELSENCEWTWTTQNGHKGYIVTGPNNKNIFLPAAGYKGNTGGVSSVGSSGYYWSSSLYTLSPISAICIYFRSIIVGGASDEERYTGASVRPVSAPRK